MLSIFLGVLEMQQQQQKKGQHAASKERSVREKAVALPEVATWWLCVCQESVHRHRVG